METGVYILIGTIIAAAYTIYINNRSEDRNRKQHARNKTYELFYNSKNIHNIRDKFIRANRLIPNPIDIKSLDQLNSDQMDCLIDLFFDLEIPAGLLLIGDLDEKIMFNARRYYEDSWAKFGSIIYLMRQSESPRYFYDAETLASIWYVASRKEDIIFNRNDSNSTDAIDESVFVFSWLRRYEPQSTGILHENSSHWSRYAPKFRKQLEAIVAGKLENFPLEFHEGGLRNESSNLWVWFSNVTSKRDQERDQR